MIEEGSYIFILGIAQNTESMQFSPQTPPKKGEPLLLWENFVWYQLMSFHEKENYLDKVE